MPAGDCQHLPITQRGLGLKEIYSQEQGPGQEEGQPDFRGKEPGGALPLPRKPPSRGLEGF